MSTVNVSSYLPAIDGFSGKNGTNSLHYQKQRHHESTTWVRSGDLLPSTNKYEVPFVLAIQSHVTRSCVGAVAFTFPLQWLGFHVSSIYTCQFVDLRVHKGTVLHSTALRTLLAGVLPVDCVEAAVLEGCSLSGDTEKEKVTLCIEGEGRQIGPCHAMVDGHSSSAMVTSRERPSICDVAEKASPLQTPNPPKTPGDMELKTLLESRVRGWSAHEYDYVASGFIGDPALVNGFAVWMRRLRNFYEAKGKRGPLFFCDPVLGDDGHLYVHPLCVLAYRNSLLPYADIIVPNQWEALWLAHPQLVALHLEKEQKDSFSSKNGKLSSMPTHQKDSKLTRGCAEDPVVGSEEQTARPSEPVAADLKTAGLGSSGSHTSQEGESVVGSGQYPETFGSGWQRMGESQISFMQKKGPQTIAEVCDLLSDLHALGPEIVVITSLDSLKETSDFSEQICCCAAEQLPSSKSVNVTCNSVGRIENHFREADVCSGNVAKRGEPYETDTSSARGYLYLIASRKSRPNSRCKLPNLSAGERTFSKRSRFSGDKPEECNSGKKHENSSNNTSQSKYTQSGTGGERTQTVAGCTYATLTSGDPAGADHIDSRVHESRCECSGDMSHSISIGSFKTEREDICSSTVTMKNYSLCPKEDSTTGHTAGWQKNAFLIEEDKAASRQEKDGRHSNISADKARLGVKNFEGDDRRATRRDSPSKEEEEGSDDDAEVEKVFTGDALVDEEDDDALYIVTFPRLPYSLCGTGDLWTAVFLASFHRMNCSLKKAVEAATAATQAVLRRTIELHGDTAECIDVVSGFRWIREQEGFPLLHRAFRIPRQQTKKKTE